MANKRATYGMILEFGYPRYGLQTAANVDPEAYKQAAESGDCDARKQIMGDYKKECRRLMKALAQSIRRRAKTKKGSSVVARVTMVASCTASTFEANNILTVLENLYRVNPDRWQKARDKYEKLVGQNLPAKLHIHVLVDVNEGIKELQRWVRKYWSKDHRYGSVKSKRVDRTWMIGYLEGQALCKEEVNVNSEWHGWE